MKKTIAHILCYVGQALLSLRYRINIIGSDQLNTQLNTQSNTPQPTLFLANHPCYLVDPMFLNLYLFKRVKVSALINQTDYEHPFFSPFLKVFRAIPIPRMEKQTALKPSLHQNFVDALKHVAERIETHAEAVIIYPAGKLKKSSHERLRGNSSVHRILSGVPSCRILLVRSTGYWGSCFSHAGIVSPTHIIKLFFFCLGVVLVNGIFFVPKRNITYEFFDATDVFPKKGSKTEQNAWLEQWFNQSPDAVDGEKVVHVPYFFWTQCYVRLRSFFCFQFANKGQNPSE